MIESFRPIEALIGASHKEPSVLRAALMCGAIYADISKTLMLLMEQMDQYAETDMELLHLRSDLSLHATLLLRDNKTYYDALVSKVPPKNE